MNYNTILQNMTIMIISLTIGYYSGTTNNSMLAIGTPILFIIGYGVAIWQNQE